MQYKVPRQCISNNKIMKPQCKLVLYVLCKATGIAKEHSINKISIVMIVGKFKIMRSGPKAVTLVYLFGYKGVENVEWIVSDAIKPDI